MKKSQFGKKNSNPFMTTIFKIIVTNLLKHFLNINRIPNSWLLRDLISFNNKSTFFKGTKQMKKWLLLTIISAFALVLAACGGGDSGAKSSEDYTKEKPFIIKFSHVTAIDSVKGKSADYFAKLVDEKQMVV